MNDVAEEPVLPPRLRRPLVAMWISLGLHAALIALVQVAPPASDGQGSVIEARLVERHVAPVAQVPQPQPTPAKAEPAAKPQLAPSEDAPSLPPVAPPAPQAPASPAPAVAEPSAQVSPASAPASPAAITSAVDLTYYSVRELDVQPRALREIVPVYPDEADRQGLSGKVHVQLKLEADGRVSEAAVVSAVPPGVFEDSALDALRRARFAPAQKNGRPVRAQVVITVVYDWEGRQRR